MNVRTAAARIKAAAMTVIKNSAREGEAVALTEVIHVNSFRGVNEPLPWWVVSTQKEPFRKVFAKLASESEANQFSQKENERTSSMAWIQTADGKKFDLQNPTADSIDPDILARVLARIPRFGGHWKSEVEWYSVAQHSVIVSNLVPPHLRLVALLHDAHEAYWGFGDILRPAKVMNASVHGFLKIQSDLVDAAIAERFDISPAYFHLNEIKHADNIALATEARDIMAPPPEPWESLPPCRDMRIRPLGINEAYQLFSERLGYLWMEHISTTSGTGKSDCQNARASHAG